MLSVKSDRGMSETERTIFMLAGNNVGFITAKTKSWGQSVEVDGPFCIDLPGQVDAFVVNGDIKDQ